MFEILLVSKEGKFINSLVYEFEDEKPGSAYRFKSVIRDGIVEIYAISLRRGSQGLFKFSIPEDQLQ